tara:strand:+ start:62967 stop:63893 length:927 start_codon:yes stop_codon:yes gene_type:complete
MADEPAILLCGHGSRDIEAVSEFQNLAKLITKRLPNRFVDHGFLEFARPTIGEKLTQMRNSGISRVEALPGMLFAAGHAKNDIPSVLNNFIADNDGFEISYGRELAIHPKLIAASRARIENAEQNCSEFISREDTLLLVVGRGTSDPDANSNISKVTRMLWEGMNFGWAEVAYTGVTYPLIRPALEKVVKLGFNRIMVFPYFLFTGVLVKRIYDAVNEARENYKDINFSVAKYLGDHPLVVDSFISRLDEITLGKNVMNCQLCKYREQIIGYEHDHGAAQVGHHHHVEGIGTESEQHHHSHNHDKHNE